MSKTIRVGEETHAKLAELRGADESFEEVIERLLAERRERVRDGAGLWSEGDAAERARDARASMKEDVGPR